MESMSNPASLLTSAALNPEQDSTTTIDPCYVIRLIRRLIPTAAPAAAAPAALSPATSAPAGAAPAVVAATTDAPDVLSERRVTDLGYEEVEVRTRECEGCDCLCIGEPCIVHGMFRQYGPRVLSPSTVGRVGNGSRCNGAELPQGDSGLPGDRLRESVGGAEADGATAAAAAADEGASADVGRPEAAEWMLVNRDASINEGDERIQSRHVAAAGAADAHARDAVTAVADSGAAAIGSPTAAAGEEETLEEAGCVLWDLAASSEHAALMVRNLMLPVAMAVLTSSAATDRLKEICLGILANMVCHAETASAVSRHPGLPHAVVHQLFSSDAPTLVEACRLVATILKLSGEGDAGSWHTALSCACACRRVLWIVTNTANAQLELKSVELLSAITAANADAARASAALPAQESVAMEGGMRQRMVACGLVDALVALVGSHLQYLTSRSRRHNNFGDDAEEDDEGQHGEESNGRHVADAAQLVATLFQTLDNLLLCKDSECKGALLSHARRAASLASTTIQLAVDPDFVAVEEAAATAVVFLANLLAETRVIDHSSSPHRQMDEETVQASSSLHVVLKDSKVLAGLFSMLVAMSDDVGSDNGDDGARGAVWSVVADSCRAFAITNSATPTTATAAGAAAAAAPSRADDVSAAAAAPTAQEEVWRAVAVIAKAWGHSGRDLEVDFGSGSGGEPCGNESMGGRSQMTVAWRAANAIMLLLCKWLNDFTDGEGDTACTGEWEHLESAVKATVASLDNIMQKQVAQ